MERRKARRSWSSVMQTLRDQGYQPRLLYPAKLSITIEGQNKIFYDKTKFNQYLATNPVLHKVLEGNLQSKEVSYIHKNMYNRCTAANSKEGKTHTHNNITNNEN